MLADRKQTIQVERELQKHTSVMSTAGLHSTDKSLNVIYNNEV